MQRIHLQRHEQVHMVHQNRTWNRHLTINGTKIMPICGPTGVKYSRVPSPNKVKTDQAALQSCNGFCIPPHPSQLCTTTEKPKIRRVIKVKERFWDIQLKTGMIIKHYHVDITRFSDNALINLVSKQGQTISYCGVNVHFQNGIAGNRIRHLQEKARKQRLHAK